MCIIAPYIFKQLTSCDSQLNVGSDMRVMGHARGQIYSSNPTFYYTIPTFPLTVGCMLGKFLCML